MSDGWKISAIISWVVVGILLVVGIVLLTDKFVPSWEERRAEERRLEQERQYRQRYPLQDPSRKPPDRPREREKLP